VIRSILVFCTLSAIIVANDSIDLESDFLQSLEEVSEIATKTKLNIDDTPSFVTVLHNEKLQKLGINNVFEALSLVSGVQLKKENFGVPTVVFRGATQKGEVKLLIDGVDVNTNYRGSIYHYLDFPIELIKRIEVIRGAGSVLYGSGAISGVVNIITYSSQEENFNKVFTSAGSYDNYMIGAVLSNNITKKIKLNADAYYQKDHKSIKTGPDIIGTVGDSDQGLKNYSIGLNLSNENLSFTNRIKSSDFGNSHGFKDILDQDTNDYNNLNESFFTQIKYQNSINSSNKYSILTGYQEYSQKIKGLFYPTFAYADTHYKENSYFTKVQLTSKSLDNHHILLGAEYLKSKVIKNIFKINNSNVQNFSVRSNSDRRIFSVFINDTFNVSQKLDILAGLRYNNYSNNDDNIMPSLGAVYKIDNSLRLKSTYIRSFRDPSWLETNNYPDFQEEKGETLEFGVVYKANPNNKLEINFYKTKIKDVIVQPTIFTYEQSGENKMYGSELQYTYTPDLKSQLVLSATYIDAKDKLDNDLADVSNFLANGRYTYQINSNLSTGTLLKYISSSSRSINDTREDFDDKFIFDQTISYNAKDFTLSFTIKDIFNEGTSYPLPAGTYVNDYQDNGRVFFAKTSWHF
jgi:iron complex outermembrane receptor protein